MRYLLLSCRSDRCHPFAIFAAVFAAPVSAHAQAALPAPPVRCRRTLAWLASLTVGLTAHAQGYTQGNHYFVVSGDTLFSIGQRFCVSVDSLRAANGISGWLAGAIPGLSFQDLVRCPQIRPLSQPPGQHPGQHRGQRHGQPRSQPLSLARWQSSAQAPAPSLLRPLL